MPLKDLFLVLKEYPNIYFLFTLRICGQKLYGKSSAKARQHLIGGAAGICTDRITDKKPLEKGLGGQSKIL